MNFYYSCHPDEGRDPFISLTEPWIPAYAGMTKKIVFTYGETKA